MKQINEILLVEIHIRLLDSENLWAELCRENPGNLYYAKCLKDIQMTLNSVLNLINTKESTQ